MITSFRKRQGHVLIIPMLKFRSRKITSLVVIKVWQNLTSRKETLSTNAQEGKKIFIPIGMELKIINSTEQSNA